MDEVTSLLKRKYVDSRKYSEADWQRMRNLARESVVGRSLRRGGRVAKPGTQDWGHEEVTALLAQLRDPHTQHLKATRLTTSVEADEGTQLSLGCGLSRARYPSYVPLAAKQALSGVFGRGSDPLLQALSPDSARIISQAVRSAHLPPKVSYSLAASSAAEVAVRTAKKQKRPWLPVATLTAGVGAKGYVTASTLTPVIVSQVLPASAAETARLQPGDHILRMDHGVYTDIDVETSNAVFLGESNGAPQLQPGVNIELLVWRPQSEDTAARLVSIEPAPIQRVTVQSRLLDTKLGRFASKHAAGGNPVGYLRIQAFSRLTGTECEAALAGLLKQGVQSLVLDMRGNPGGSIAGASEIPSLFLPPGTPVMSLENAQGKLDTVRTHKRKVQCFDVPLLVLVDAKSASASEVIVGCLKDHGRATVLGERTYGKGLAQGMYGLRDGSGALISILRLRTPSGAQIHGMGVAPHRYAVSSSIDINTLQPAEMMALAANG